MTTRICALAVLLVSCCALAVPDPGRNILEKMPLIGDLLGSLPIAVGRNVVDSKTSPEDAAAALKAFGYQESDQPDEKNPNAPQYPRIPKFEFLKRKYAGATGCGFETLNGRVWRVGLFFKDFDAKHQRKVLGQIKGLGSMDDPYSKTSIAGEDAEVIVEAYQFSDHMLIVFSVHPADWIRLHEKVPPGVALALKERRWADGMTPAQGVVVNDGPGTYIVLAKKKRKPIQLGEPDAAPQAAEERVIGQDALGAGADTRSTYTMDLVAKSRQGARQDAESKGFEVEGVKRVK